jgi:peptidoglycan/LPS O-acetylase OafA/YrhL
VTSTRQEKVIVKHRPFLDGIRATAALYVVLHHIAIILEFNSNPAGIPYVFLKILRFFDFGHYAVDVFIVLSGFCLMLPLSVANTLRLPDVKEYFVRRAWRIIPPYYAAILVSLALNALSDKIELTHSVTAFAIDPKLTVGDLCAHLFLVHNLVDKFALKINPPFWSIGTEWQIYFLFPFLFLACARRIGIVTATGVALAVSLVPHFFFHGLLDPAAPWCLGLFAFGACASWYDLHSPIPEKRRELIYGSITMLILGGFTFVGNASTGWLQHHRWFADIIMGLAGSFFILYCSGLARKAPNQHGFIVHCLCSAPAFLVGSFSYSMYMIHYPILRLIDVLLLAYHVTPLERALFLTIGGVSIAVFCSWLFSLCVEAPVLRARAARKKRHPLRVETVDQTDASGADIVGANAA